MTVKILVDTQVLRGLIIYAWSTKRGLTPEEEALLDECAKAEASDARDRERMKCHE